MTRGSASPESESDTDSPLARSIVIVSAPEHIAAPAGVALKPTVNGTKSTQNITATRSRREIPFADV
jgi:hypothetical protein